MNLQITPEKAEICGIFAGDGTLYKTTDSGFVLEIRGGTDEVLYYRHVKLLFENLFNRKIKILKRKYKGGFTIGIRLCGKLVMDVFHNTFNFPIGKKSRTVKIPSFILNSKKPEIWKSYLRGEFDTDGSIYIKKTGNKNRYKQPVVSFTSLSYTHLLQIKDLLDRLDFNSWIEKSNFRVRLCGWSTIKRFLKLINPNNERHWKRVKRLMPRIYAEVA